MFETIGAIFITGVLVILIPLFIAIFLGVRTINGKKYILPGFIIFTLDQTYYISKKISSLAGLPSDIIDLILIELRNHTQKKAYEKTPLQKRIVIVPYCLRSRSCKCRMDPISGITCKICGRCKLSKLKKFCNKRKVNMYIVPGGSFVRRIIKKDKPKAVLCVACSSELNEALSYVYSKKIPTQGVLLSKTGCFETDVSISKIKERILAGVK